MPLFEYECQRCDARFELLVRNGDQPACPECGDEKPRKLLSAPAAHVPGGEKLPIVGSCPPADAPPCSPNCCRL